MGLKKTGENQERDSNGRFVPGQSGNPDGRPKGITNSSVKLRKQLLEPILPTAIDELKKAVTAGERWAVEAVVAYTLPKPKPVDPDELAAFEARLEQLEQAAEKRA